MVVEKRALMAWECGEWLWRSAVETMGGGGWLQVRGRCSRSLAAAGHGALWRAPVVSEPGSRRLDTARIAWRTVRVIAVELVGDLGEGQRGLLARQVHRELPGVRDAGVALGREEVLRGRRRRTEQTASWIVWTLGEVSACGDGGRAGESSLGDRCRARAAERRRDGFAEHGGERRDAGHRALKPPNVAEHQAGDLLQRRGVVAAPRRPPAAIRHRSAVRVRRSGQPSSADSPQREAVAKALCQPGERLRRPVAGEHDLLAGRVKGVERVDELLLRVPPCPRAPARRRSAARRAPGSAA